MLGVPALVTLCLLALGALLLGVRAAQSRLALSAEVSRKLMHVGVGLIALPFPWLFSSPAPVWTVCGVAALVMIALKVAAPLRRSLGAAVHGVERASLGDLYFLASVPALFTVAPEPIFYLVPILVLTFADALAALIGVSYGRRRYAGEDGEKSLEGSAAFLVVAFLASLVPLLLLTDLGRAETLLISVLIGFLVMLIEAVAWEGIDNLFVPFGTFVILRGNFEEGAGALLAQLGAACLIVVAFFALRRFTKLRGSALVGAALVCFTCWSIAGAAWLVAPVTLFALALVLWTRGALAELGTAEVLGLVAPALVWLLLAVYRGHPEFFYPYTLALAGLATALAARVAVRAGRPSRLALAGLVLVVGTLFLGPYFALVGRPVPWSALHGALTLVLIALVSGVLAQRGRLDLQFQAHLAGLAGVVGYALTALTS